MAQLKIFSVLLTLVFANAIQGLVIPELLRSRFGHGFPQISDFSNDFATGAVDNIHSYLNGLHIPGLDRFSSYNYPSLMSRFVNYGSRLFPSLVNPHLNGGFAGDNAAAAAAAAAAAGGGVPSTNGAGIPGYGYGYGYRPRFLRRYSNNYGLGGVGGGGPANAASSAAAAAGSAPAAGGLPVAVSV